MVRFENIIPFPDHEKFKTIFDSGLVPDAFRSEIINLSPDDITWLKLLNGTSSLKETFDLLYKKGFPANFRKRMQLFTKLVDQKFFKNHTELRQALNNWHTLNSGQWVQSSNIKVDKNHFTKERTIPLIQKTTLFNACEKVKAELVFNSSTIKSYSPGDVILKKDTVGDKFYILLQGEVGVILPKVNQTLELIAVLSPWAVFGESSAIFNKPRNADVRAMDDVCVLEVDTKKLVTKNNSKAFDDFKSIKSRLIINQLLAANPLFKGIPSDLLQLFLKNCRIEKYPREKFIIKQGEDSSTFYFILKGSVSVIKDDIPVKSLIEGNFFGEVATLLKEKRTASVVCEEDCLVLSIDGDKFIDVLSRNISLALKIEDEALSRFSSNTNIFSIDTIQNLWTDDSTTSVLSVLSGGEVNENFFESSATQLDIKFLDFSKIK